ncbi:putative cell surface protein [Streptococcus intermedius B196]|uniref:Putative cell surface protein n=1 Tax=Streptococcus intermedius B196 TaxID=862967 RepID=T1ZG40_STRIT|nr:putative cell surface protein [Streptococcus intermedius B196]
MRTVMKNKVFTRLMTVLLLVVMVIMAAYPSVAYAQVDEKEAAQETLKEEPKKPEITVIKKEEEKEVRYPNKLNAKEPENLKQNNAASNGEKANTNKGVASAPSKARASVTENKDNANQDYPIHHNSDKENKETDKYSADARQFITFKTKNGKTFHLIINHDEQGENVMLLTEVSEDDLLNMVEAKEKPKEVVKEEPVKQEKTEEVKPEKKEEKSSTGTYILLALVTLGALGAGYYFKIAKKKEDKELEALEEDDDFFSEAEVNEEMENEEVENQETEDETDDSEDELEE